MLRCFFIRHVSSQKQFPQNEENPFIGIGSEQSYGSERSISTSQHVEGQIAVHKNSKLASGSCELFKNLDVHMYNESQRFK